MDNQDSPSSDYAPLAHPTSRPETPTQEHRHDHGHGHGHGHGWMMALMCLPMLVVVGVLVGTGTLGVGGLLYAFGCLAMMGAMMLWMNHDNTKGTRS